MSRLLAIAAVACGCNGAVPGDDTEPDAGLPLALGWSTPAAVMLDKPAGAFAADASFTEDMSRVFYSMTMLGGSEYDLYEATMMSPTMGGARRAVLARPGVVESSPEVSPDGLVMYFLTFEGTMGRIDRITRNGLTRPWGNATTPTDLNSPADERPGNVDSPKTRIVIVRAEQLVELASAGTAWVEQMTTAALPMGARDPHLSTDALTLTYAAPDAGTSTDLYVSVRSSIDEPWGIANKLDVLSDPEMAESDPWLASDGKRIYFSRGATIFTSQR